MTTDRRAPHRRCASRLLALRRLRARPALAQTAPRQDRCRRHRLDDRRDRLVLMMTHAGPRAVLLRHGAQEERARHHGAEPRCDVPRARSCGSLLGYSLAFTGDGAGARQRSIACSCTASAWTRSARCAKTIPESLFMIYQMTFAIITVALVAGSVADRMRFSAFVLVLRCCGCSSSMCRWRTGSGAAASSRTRRRARFRRRHRGAPQCRRRRPRRRATCSASAAATAPKISRRTICRWR